MARVYNLAGAVPYKSPLTAAAVGLCTPLEKAPNTVPVKIDWAAYGASNPSSRVTVNVNLLQQVANGGFLLDKIRSIYIDNTFSSVTVYVTFLDTGHTVYALPNSSIWLPVLTNGGNALIFAEGFTTGNIPITTIQFTNIDRQGIIIPEAQPTSQDTRRGFIVSPAVSGKTEWDLDVDGPCTLDGGGAWTIQPFPLFAATIELWGPGGCAGVATTTAVGAPGNAGTATTFGSMIAEPGNPTFGATTAARLSAGVAGGIASGGQINTNGAPSTSGTAVGTVGTGGAGGASPNGGASNPAPGSNQSGVVGNAPGGGGCGASFNDAGGGIASAGGSGGAYVRTTFLINDLVPYAVYPVFVGNVGAAQATNATTRAGGRGGIGRAKIT